MAIYIILHTYMNFTRFKAIKKNSLSFFLNANGPDGGELTPLSHNYKISKICLFQLLISQKLAFLSQRKF